MLACCAFALFLVTQLLIPLRWLAARLGLEREQKPDAATLWQPTYAAAPPATTAPRRQMQAQKSRTFSLLRPLIIGFLALDLVAIGAVTFISTNPQNTANAMSTDQTAAFEAIMRASRCARFSGSK